MICIVVVFFSFFFAFNHGSEFENPITTDVIRRKVLVYQEGPIHLKMRQITILSRVLEVRTVLCCLIGETLGYILVVHRPRTSRRVSFPDTLQCALEGFRILIRPPDTCSDSVTTRVRMRSNNESAEGSLILYL